MQEFLKEKCIRHRPTGDLLHAFVCRWVIFSLKHIKCKVHRSSTCTIRPFNDNYAVKNYDKYVKVGSLKLAQPRLPCVISVDIYNAPFI